MASDAAPFATLPLASAPQVVAPDGSDLRVLLRLAGGSMVRFAMRWPSPP